METLEKSIKSIGIFNEDVEEWENNYSVNAEELERLIEDDIVHGTNYGPDCEMTLATLVIFLKKNKHLRLSGKLIQPRSQVRIGFDSIIGCKKKYTLREQLNFALKFRQADDLIVDDNELYAWWD